MKKHMLALTTALISGLQIVAPEEVYSCDENLRIQEFEPNKEQRFRVLLEEFNELFLDDWQKLVLVGKNAEAVKIARQTELACCESMNRGYHKKNTALSYNLYRLSQHRTYLNEHERYSPAYFRIYQANPEKLIETYQNNISALTKELEARDRVIKTLQEKQETSPKRRVVLAQDLESCLENFYFQRNEILASTADEVILKVLGVVFDYIKQISHIVELNKSKPYDREQALIDQDKIEEIRKVIWEILTAREWEEKRNFVDAQYREVGKIYFAESDKEGFKNEELVSKYDSLSKLSYCMRQFLSFPMGFAEKAKEWMVTDPNDTLSELDARELNNYLTNIEIFRKDTADQIEAENKRITFIRSNPSFFQIQARSRAELLGISDTSEWFVARPSHPVGHNVIVGVIDTFDTCQQKSKILEKAVNPDFTGTGYVHEVNEAVAENHGIHVAGIIVSDEVDKNNYGGSHMTVGVAPGAQFEMIDFRSIQLPSVFALPHIENQWTVEKMAEAITELSRTGTIKELGLSTDMIRGNPTLLSQARIFNYSMSTGGLKRFSRMTLHAFEGIYNLPVLVELLKSKLLVQGMGNDGINICSTEQRRLIKAFALCPETSKHFIAVTNLMQDGITLNPSSSIPGDEDYMQARSLSAPGTEITSTILTTDGQSKAYEEMSGTSMATPHVSGVAAVVLSNHPTMKTEELGKCLLDSATPLIVTDSGMTIELAYIMAYELREEFSNNVDAPAVVIRGQTVKRADWVRGKSCYGQGRVHLGNALKLADDKYADLT